MDKANKLGFKPFFLDQHVVFTDRVPTDHYSAVGTQIKCKCLFYSIWV